MSATAETTINGRAYRLVKLPPLQAGRAALRLAQALAGALSQAEVIAPLLEAFKHAGKPADDAPIPDVKTRLGALLQDTPTILSALAGGVQKIDVDALYSVAEECVSGNLFTERKLGTAAETNAHFSEHPADLLPVMAWAVRENCAGFFGRGAQG